MAPKSVQFFIDQCFKGKFDQVCDIITTEKPRLDSSSAIKIINAVCHACHQNLTTPERLNELALERLLGVLLNFIDLTTDAHYESYLKSVFHILKLLEKKNIDTILHLERLFLPPFKPLILTDQHITLYKSICSTLYNVIVRIVQGGPHKGAASDLCLLLTRLCAKTNNKPKLLETIHNCLIAHSILKSAPLNVLKFYKFSLNLITGLNTSLYPQVIKNFNLIYNNLLKSGANDSASASYRLTMTKLKEWFPGPEFEGLSEIMGAVEWGAPKGAPLSHDALFIAPVCELIANVATTRLQLYKTKPEVWRAEAECHTLYYKFLAEIAEILGRFDKKGALRVLDAIAGLARLTIVGSEQLPKTYKLEVLTYLDSFSDVLDVFKSQSDKWGEFWYDLGVHLYTIGVHLGKKNDSELSVLYLRKFVQKYYEYQGFESSFISKNYVIAALQLISDHHLKHQKFEQCLHFIALAILFGGDRKTEIQRWILAKVDARERNVPNIQELTLVSVLANSDFSLDKVTKIELLEVELFGYSERWQSKISMSSALAELSQLAEPVRTAQVITEVWTSGDLPVHETFAKILHKVINRFEKVRKCPTLAHLYFLKHKYAVKASVLKHCEVRALNEPNEQCDLIRSENLKLSSLNDLQKSLDLCRTCPKSSDYRLLANIGHEFRLHGHTFQALEAWQLAYNQARSPAEKTESIAFMIEFSDPSKPYVQSLIDEAERSVECLKSEKNYTELIVYFLCKCEAFFYSNFETSYTAFKRATNLLKTSHVSDILLAKIFLTEHKFLTLPCEFGVEGHKEFSIVRIHQASYKATSYFNKSRCSSYEMRIFFEIFEALARMYTDLRLPLQVRSSAKATVLIAQEMLLPFRTTAILFYLANADVLTMRFDDARVKIRDFSDIVGLGYGDVDLNKRIDELCEELVHLDVEAQSSDAGSPTFRNETFKPDFMRHEPKCECFNCMSFEYRDSVLKISYLSGLLALYEGKLSQAKNFFTGAITVYKFIKNNHSVFTEKWAKKITPDLVPNLTSLLETYCFVLLSWTNCALNHGRVTSAEKMNNTVLKNLEAQKLKYPHLYYEALTQKLNILLFETDEETKLQVEESEDISDRSAKTPENRISKVTVSPNVVPNTVEKYRIRPKSLKFVLSDDEEEEERGKTPIKAKKNKTPAPSSSKIKIYADDKKKGSVLTEKQVPNQSEEANFKTPAPSASKVKRGALENDVLASRTRLLTEKLRSSSQKVKKEVDGVRTSLFQEGEGTGKCLRTTRSQR